MQRAVDADAAQQLHDDGLDDPGNDVADQKNDQEPDQARHEREERVQALLDRVADVHGSEEHENLRRLNCGPRRLPRAKSAITCNFERCPRSHAAWVRTQIRCLSPVRATATLARSRYSSSGAAASFSRRSSRCAADSGSAQAVKRRCLVRLTAPGARRKPATLSE